MLPSHRLSFQAKVITAAVAAKAVLMGTLVSLLAIASFDKSIILVLISAVATGIFGILIVLIQVHADRSTHVRLDRLEEKATTAADAATTAATQAQTIVDAVTNGLEHPKA